MTPGLQQLRRDAARTVSRRRGLLAAGLTAGAVATALQSLVPAPVEGVTVLAAARDLAPGGGLTAEDLRAVELPRSQVPDGALTAPTAVLGRTLAGAVRRGEPLTDVRLVSPALLTGLTAGQVAVPVRLTDPVAAALLSTGDRVDVLAAASDAAGAPDGGARVVAAGVLVLAVPQATEFEGEGALVVVAASSATAVRLAGAAVAAQLSAVIRPA